MSRVQYEDPAELAKKNALAQAYCNWKDFILHSGGDKHRTNESVRTSGEEFFKKHLTDEEMDLLDFACENRKEANPRTAYLQFTDSIITICSLLDDTEMLIKATQSHFRDTKNHLDISEVFKMNLNKTLLKKKPTLTTFQPKIT